MSTLSHHLARSVRSGVRFSSTASRPPPRRIPRLITTLSLATALSLGTYSVGAVYPPETISLLFPRPAQAPPSDPDSPASQAYIASLESTLQSLPILASLRAQPDADEWYETRPYMNLPEDTRVNNLTGGALRGPGKLALPPLVRARRDESEAWVLIHVGRGLCGHDGIVHGGLLATLLDEALARIAIKNLPDHVGVTANLDINFRAPTRADQFIIIKTRLSETKGRKSCVSGQVEDLNGNVLVDATAIFVQPRYAKLLNSAAIEQALGTPGQQPVHLAHGDKLKTDPMH